MIRIDRDNPGRADVQELLSEHLADMFATSPAESVHALDSAALSGPAITFWTAREDSEVLGCGALKLLEPGHGRDQVDAHRGPRPRPRRRHPPAEPHPGRGPA